MARAVRIISVVMLLMVVIHLSASTVSGMDITDHDLVSEESLWAMYLRWCTHYLVVGDVNEKARRFDVFVDNARFIHEFNKGGEPYKLDLNRFADLTEEEVSRSYDSCYKADSSMLRSGKHQGSFKHGFLSERDLPSEVDWRMRRMGGLPGCVTDVHDQRLNGCGSCWAFTTTAAIEGLTSIITDKLIPLSAQQLIDCNKENHGCSGGTANKAFDYIKKVHGLVPEGSYPYTGRQGTCITYPSASMSIDGYEWVPRFDAIALKKAVSQQPVVVAIDANNTAFIRYRGGVFQGQCGTNLNHQVIVIGYGKDYDSGGTGLDYWLIKNSWGSTWGEFGYMRLSRNVSAKEGLCGILMDPLYPVKNGY